MNNLSVWRKRPLVKGNGHFKCMEKEKEVGCVEFVRELHESHNEVLAQFRIDHTWTKYSHISRCQVME